MVVPWGTLIARTKTFFVVGSRRGRGPGEGRTMVVEDNQDKSFRRYVHVDSVRVCGRGGTGGMKEW